MDKVSPPQQKDNEPPQVSENAEIPRIPDQSEKELIDPKIYEKGTI